MKDQDSISDRRQTIGMALSLLRRGIVLLLGVMACLPPAHAEFVATSQFWDPDFHLEESPACRPQKTKSAFCAQNKPCVYTELVNPYRYCQTIDDGKLFDICRDSADSCDIGGALDMDVPVSPICVPDVQVWAKRFDSRPPSGNISFVAFDEETKRCGCPYLDRAGKTVWQENPKVDWEHAWCKVPVHIGLIADRTNFTFSEPNREVELTATLTDSNGKPVRYTSLIWILNRPD